MKVHFLKALFASFAAAIVTTSFVACDKADKNAAQKPAQPQAPADGSAEKPEKTVPPSAVPSAAVAALGDAYGFVARIPNDVEGFSATYRLHDLWEKLSNSKWAATLLNMPAVKQSAQCQAVLQQWKTAPQAPMAKNLLEALFGTEFVVVQPAGFAEKFMPLVDLIGEMQAVNFQRQVMTMIGGGKAPKPEKLLMEAAPDLIPALVKCDVPPIYFVFKAAKARADIDGALGQFVKQLTTQLPPGVQPGQFKLLEKYDFQNITVTAKKLIAAFDEARLQIQLKEFLGDDAKAREAMSGILAKRAELAWGWVDDHFVISLGADHSHLKFADAGAGSALSIPAVARRAAQFVDRRPTGLSYGSAALLKKLQGPVEFAKDFESLTEELEGLIKPDQIAAMRADVKRIEAKAQDIFTAKFDPLVNVGFWDGGLRGESFGGAGQKMLDSSKPLTFAGLITPSVMIFGDGRRNAEASAKVADFIEDTAGAVWGWYEKFGRTMVPEGERQGAAMIETIALPMVKDLWRAGRHLSNALGDESAFLLDLNGMMPKIPGLPPALSDGRVPRLAWVWELKNRAGVSEAWKVFDRIIKQLSGLVPKTAGAPPIPDPQMTKDGDVELHFFPLPVPTGDLLPHIAITKDRWMIGTSPGFSKEMASKSPANGTAPLGSEWRIQFPALCDLGEAWLKVIDKDPKGVLGASDVREYQAMRPMFGDALGLMRSLRAIEWRLFEEGGETRNSVFLNLEDLK